MPPSAAPTAGPEPGQTLTGRLIGGWVPGGALAGLLLAALAPVLAHRAPPWFLPCFLLLPAYMLHQFEEHDTDRFRRFVNETVAGGTEALTPLAVFVINIPGVWGVLGASLALAVRVRPGLGLIGVGLVLVNALVHLGALIKLRRYNPGLVSAVLLLLPAGIAAGWALLRAGAGGGDMLIGLAAGVLIHVWIVAHMRRRIARGAPGRLV